MSKKYNIILACCDEPEPWRKQEADIIAVVPASHPGYSIKERKEHIIIPCELTEAEAQFLSQAQYANGETEAQVAATVGTVMPKPAKVNKRQYSFKFSILKSELALFDEAKAKDKKTDYQPFLDGDISFNSADKKPLFFNKYKGTYKYKEAV